LDGNILMERQLIMPTKKFIVVVEEDIAGDFMVPGNDKFLPFQEALLDSFKIIEVSPEMDVIVGQKYDGTEFIKA
jgi:hypothetical protein